jgi:hypothetical protein
MALGCSAPSASEEPAVPDGTLLVRAVNLGSLQPAGAASADFVVINPGSQVVDIARVETSCDCLHLDLPRKRLQPSERMPAHATLDLHSEPEFRGKLAIDVTGHGPDGKVVFRTVISATVGGAGHSPAAKSKSAAKLVAHPDILDFGRVHNSKGLLELSFTIANQGHEAVEIAGVRSGCGCTVANVSESKVAPRGQAVVSLKVNLANRMGRFTNTVLVDVAGCDTPLAVRLQGTIIQDVWCSEPMIHCHVKDPASPVEKRFELRTIDWPDVQFDWKAIGKGISIKEISRSKQGDETVIEMHVTLMPTENQLLGIRQIALEPTDKRIKPLTIPVAIHGTPPSLPQASQTKKSGIAPEVISVGVFSRNSKRRLQLSAPRKLADSVALVGRDGFPGGTTVELLPRSEAHKDRVEVAIRLDRTAPLGPLNGTIRMKSADGQVHSVEVVGIVGPEEAETETQNDDRTR